MCTTMPKAAPKDKREEVPGDTATTEIYTILFVGSVRCV